MGTELTITEVASILAVSDQRVRTLCRAGLLSSRKVGVSWLIEEQSVLRYGLITAHKIAEDHPAY
jgi:DNA (cytosine-5)-methyltransferase 1